jgi:dTDP-4-dehydrorhamnose reductase
MRVLVLGVTGMLGNAVFKTLTADPAHEIWGTLRDEAGKRFFREPTRQRLTSNIDVLDRVMLTALLSRLRPEVVINCTGLVKQLPTANDPLIVLPINAMFPHQLAAMCRASGSRLIQLSSDCVFSGRKGNYEESDLPDADDLYGKSKAIGELLDHPHAITLRTSGIGHELMTNRGLLEWFLSQQREVQGFARAIYSGLPSVELARVIKDFVLPHPEMRGLYHISARPIAKLDLLQLIAKIYGKNITIAFDQTFALDRSLNSRRFTQATGYVAAEWPELIALMHRRQHE